MKLRVARHTNDLANIIQFYVNTLGLENLGSFTDHDGYNGVFLGWRTESWHLEFTTSNNAPIHQPDEDDLLVFYCKDVLQKNTLADKIQKAGHRPIKPKNPYWITHAICYKDPDGFIIALTVE